MLCGKRILSEGIIYNPHPAITISTNPCNSISGSPKITRNYATIRGRFCYDLQTY